MLTTASRQRSPGGRFSAPLDAALYQATPIQQEVIPEVLKGRDLVGCAQTGTGKTAAFALPTLQQLMTSAPAPTGASRRRQRSGRRTIRALILAPTRELAGQIGDSLAIYGRFTGLRHATATAPSSRSSSASISGVCPASMRRFSRSMPKG